MKSALDVHGELLARAVPHEMVRLPQVIGRAADLPRVLGIEPARCVAVRCFAPEAPSEHALVAVLVRVCDDIDPEALAAAVPSAAPLRPATAAQTSAATDYPATLVSPVGLPRRVLLLADARVSSNEVLYCATGEGGVALGMRTRDLLVASGASVTALAGWRTALARPPAGALPEPRRGRALATG